MTTEAEWIALAERCEKATGPDRELDAAIYDAVNGGSDAWEAIRKWGGVQWIEHHTSSLDAITALIERELNCSWRAGNTPSGRGFALLGTNTKEHAASSPALALCAAFCRAMAEKVTT